MADTPAVPDAAVQIVADTLSVDGWAYLKTRAATVVTALARAGWLHDPARVAELEAARAELDNLMPGDECPVCAGTV